MCYENDDIDEVNNIKFLGITLDINLSWEHCIDVQNNKLCTYCYAPSVLVDVASVEYNIMETYTH